MTPAQLEQTARETMDVTMDARRRLEFSCDNHGLARFAGLVRAAALEEALAACEAQRELDCDGQYQEAIGDCKDAIRALAKQEGDE